MVRLALIALLVLAARPARAQGAAPVDTVCARPEYRRFDFMAGDWVVRDTVGRVIGHSRIAPAADGCALHERWDASNGASVGESLTTYQPRTGRWHQLYAGSGGYVIDMSGAMEGDRMVMRTAPYPLRRDSSVMAVERWTWERVDAARRRQRSELSTDGGRSWRTQFVGVYEPAGR